MSATLAPFRPRDDSVAAVRHALTALAEERQAVERRLVEVRSARAKALLEATTKEIAELEEDTRQTELQQERLDGLKPGLEQKLSEARVMELRAAVDRRAAAAEAAIADLAAALEEYPVLAEKIAHICRLNRAAQAAIMETQHAAQAAGQRRVFNPPSVQGGQLADLVVLPSQSGKYHWGAPPPPRSVYSNTPVVI